MNALKAGADTLDASAADDEALGEDAEPEDVLRAMLHDPKFKARSFSKLRKASGTTEEELTALLEKLGARQVTMRTGRPGWTLRS